MSDFCVATINPEPTLRTQHGILRADALTLTLDAHAAAAHIRQEAQRDAAQVAQAVHEQARSAVREAERQTLARAADLLRALEEKNAELLLGAQDLVVELALELFDRLVAGMTPRERIEANCRRLLQEAPRHMAHPVLWLHPDDGKLTPELDWEIKTDPTLAVGSCRLEASDGEWRANFTEGVAALKEAFGKAAAQGQPVAPPVQSDITDEADDTENNEDTEHAGA